MIDEKVREQLASSAALVDQATARACERLIGTRGREWSAWEVSQGLEDLMKLSDGDDCTYDRRSIGVSYALWYHGRRTHEAMRILLPYLARATGSVRIVDLGCGTGATACAVALIVAALERVGAPGPDRAVVDGIDSSPFMVETAQAVFEEMGGGGDSDRVGVSFRACAWESVHTSDLKTTVIFCGYLLDHSDGAHGVEIARRLQRLGDRMQASSALLTTSDTKRDRLDDIARTLTSDGWSKDSGFAPWSTLGNGAMPACHDLRNRWYGQDHRLEQSWLWTKPPRWSESQPPRPLMMLRPAGRAGPTLFDDPRDERLYDAEQRDAATPDGRLTVITGAAGSGKTIVLAERIVRTAVMAPAAEPAPRILVTAFNKNVIELLADEIERGLQAASGTKLDYARGSDGYRQIDLTTRRRAGRIVLMNRDKLPTRVFGVSALDGGLKVPGRHWRAEIERRKEDLGRGEADAVRDRSSDFLEDEFERVIYGQALFDPAAYREHDRFGRGTRMSKKTKDVVWQLLMQPPIPSFIHQRIRAYQAHEHAVAQGRRADLCELWTHAFVDECQDFTPTDLQLLARVPATPRHLCIAGDASQSVHLGKSYRRPGIAGAQWKQHRLGGSYRLPLRVCEALTPLAKEIRDSHHVAQLDDDLDTVLLRSRKAALSGFRPIILAAETLDEHLPGLLHSYLGPDPGARILAADCQKGTRRIVERCADSKWCVESGTMEKYKGLEWPCVIVTDERKPWEDTSEAASERLFTAMTRTTRLLVVVLWRDGDAATKSMLGQLDERRVLCYDQAANRAFERAQFSTAGAASATS